MITLLLLSIFTIGFLSGGVTVLLMANMDGKNANIQDKRSNALSK